MSKLRRLSFMLVISIICSVVFIGCSPKKNKLAKEKQQFLAYGAILGTRNHQSNDELGADSSDNKQMLKEYWNITSKETAIGALDWLVKEGHRIDSDKILTEIKSGNANNIPQLKSTIGLYNKANSTMRVQLKFSSDTIKNVKTVAAWDSDRLVNVARWCYSAGYITEQEAWSYIEKAVSMAKSNFNSWEEYYISFAYGRAIAYEGDIDEIIDAGKELFEDSDSIWKQYNFK